MADTGKPLVTISMMTYNQEKYVRDSVRGLFAQTYEPLEIVISDDCSNDRTWDIILEEVEKYRKSGGQHEIVLNRNDHNLGIAANAAKVARLEHGLISVGNGGDDISFPNRVTKIVEAWERSNGSASYIWHQSVWMDTQSRCLHIDNRYSLERPSGAVCAYVNLPEKRKFIFAPYMTRGGWEDWVAAFRTRFYGGAIEINEPLVFYRCGSGVSTSSISYRAPLIRCANSIQSDIQQARVDLKNNLMRISEVKYLELMNFLDTEDRRTKLLLEQVSGRNFLSRWRAFRKRFPELSFSRGYVIQIILTMPLWVGDLILNIYMRTKNIFERFLFPLRHREIIKSLETIRNLEFYDER